MTSIRSDIFFLEQILDHITDPVFVKDESFQRIWVNEAYCLYMNKARDELLRKTDYELFPKKQADIFHEIDIQVFQEDKKNEHKEKVTYYTGSLKTIVTKKSIFYVGKKKFLVGIIQDITLLEKKQEELEKNFQKIKKLNREIKREKNLIKTIMDTVPDRIYIKDKESRFVMANKAMVKRLGLRSLNQVIGKTDFDFFWDEFAEIFFKDEKNIIETQTAIIEKTEKNIINRKIYWSSVTKVPYENTQWEIIGTLGISRDITTRKKLEDRLKKLNENLEQEVEKQISKIKKQNEKIQQSQEHYLESLQKIINNIGVAIWIGTSQNKTLYINDFFRDLMELPEKKSDENPPYLYFCTKKRGLYFSKKKDAQAEKNPPKDGYIKEWHPAQFLNISSAHGMKIMIITDLKEFKQLEKDKKELQKLHTLKDEFLSITSHELRTPLTAIKGYLSMMLEGDYWEMEDETKKIIQSMYMSSERLLVLVNNLLDTSRLESENVNQFFREENFPVYSLVQDVLIQSKSLAQSKNIHLSLKRECCKEITIYTDKSKLKQVLINLIGNAIKFTPIGGKVTLQIKCSKKYITFSIIDTGVGMSEEDKKNIFEKFTQIDNLLSRKEEWSGLGLFIVKKILDKMEAPIHIESELNSGSHFYFSLPISNQ